MLRSLFRAVLFVLLLVTAFALYSLYQSGQLPRLESAVSDASVLASVKASLALNRDLRRRPIEVDSERGHVILSGRVASEAERILAEELASSIEGVDSVDNRLEPSPELAELERESPGSDRRSLGETLDDVTLLAKLRAALQLDRELRRLDVNLRVEGGRVTLEGEVTTPRVAERLRARILGVAGVVSLDDELVVRGSIRDAASVAERVQAVLAGNASLRDYQLKAVSTDEVILLEGTVETTAERELAGLLAERSAPELAVRNAIRLKETGR